MARTRHQYYLENKDRFYRHTATHRDKWKAIVDQAKDCPCVDCHERYPPHVMDFDHVRGVKLGSISQLVKSASLRRLQAEIQKCDVVCANCHRERTHQRRLTRGAPAQWRSH